MTRPTTFTAAAALFVAVAVPAQAQDIAARARSLNNGTLRFSYAVKEGVCGNGGTSISMNGDRWIQHGGSFRDEDVVCDRGPARVAIGVERGRVTRLRYYVGGSWRSDSEAEDVGEVSAASASEFLLSMIETATGETAEDAIVPLMIVRGGPDPYRSLLRIAKDQDRRATLRKSVIFWLGQEAGEVATRGLESIMSSDPDVEVRKQAVFALSQQRTEHAIDALINVVRTNKDPELRKTAMFWLGQSDHPKAFALIEEMILKR